MMGVSMNGTGQHQHEAGPSVSVTNNTQPPLVTITPPAIRITGAQIWAAIAAIPATVALLTSQGWLYKPARDSELQPIIAIVQTLQKGQEESTAAIRRLTEAVDNIGKLIPKPKNAAGALKLR